MSLPDARSAFDTRRTLTIVWLGWAVLILGFGALVQARFTLQRPDQALDWTAAETGAAMRPDHPYLADPLLAGHAVWDSEYYVSIALHGYGDPAMRAVGPASQPDATQTALKRAQPAWPGVSAAFLPGYPAAIRLLATPLIAAGARPVAAAVAAGVAVSLLGALAAALALADLASGAGGEGEGLRAGVYLLVWPGAAFLAEVYSEGLFLGLSFGALALMRRRAWPWAALLATAAVFTRATGVLLVIPFLWTYFGQCAFPRRLSAFNGREAVRALCVLSPAIAYLAWRAAFGTGFEFVETRYFGRGLFHLSDSWASFTEALDALAHGPPPAAAYEALDLAALAAALASGLALLRRDPALALYSLAVLAVTATSGSVTGALRYALCLPALFLVPARLGRFPAIDRLWTLAGALGLAVTTLALSFGFWAG